MDLKHLGKTSQEPIQAPEVIPKAHLAGMVVTLSCTEFTSFCPVTGQPDFATLTISYKVREHIVETKSLKLYLWKFREYRCFNEDLVQTIAHELFATLNPINLTVVGNFHPRGGICVSPTVQLGDFSPEV